MKENRPKVGVGVAVIKEGKLLLSRRLKSHGAGDWCFPGGHLEFGETVEECAARELIEETGITALNVELGPWVSNVIDGDKHYITLFAIVRHFEGSPQNREPNKHGDWQWFSCNSLPSPLFPPINSLLKLRDFQDLLNL